MSKRFADMRASVRTSSASEWKIKGPDGAAMKPGINPGTFYSRMKKLGVQRPRLD